MLLPEQKPSLFQASVALEKQSPIWSSTDTHLMICIKLIFRASWVCTTTKHSYAIEFKNFQVIYWWTCASWLWINFKFELLGQNFYGCILKISQGCSTMCNIRSMSSKRVEIWECHRFIRHSKKEAPSWTKSWAMKGQRGLIMRLVSFWNVLSIYCTNTV